jgi:hypothetical protein
MNLKSLTIHCGLGCSMEFLGSLSDPPMLLEMLKVIAVRFPIVPRSINRVHTRVGGPDCFWRLA